MKKSTSLDKRSGVYEITPEDAQELLDNPRWQNRPLKDSVVKKYAWRIFKRVWKLTGEPILLDLEGRLIDGQHRLQGCVLTGKSIITTVLFGDWDVLSGGQASIRGGADAMDIAFRGLRNRLGVASAVGLCMKHERAMAREVSPFTKTSNQSFKSQWSVMDNHEMVNWLKRNDGLIDIYGQAQSLGKPSRAPALVALSSCAAAWYLARNLNGQTASADVWFEGLLSGVGLQSGDVRLLMRQALQNRLTKQEKRPGNMEMLHWIAKGWRDREIKSKKHFVVKGSEDFPFFR